MSRRLITALVGSTLLGILVPGQPLHAGSPPKRPKPDLRLRVSTHAGTRPLGITITASLLGVDPQEMESCVVRADWSYQQRGTTMPLIKRKEIPCGERYAKGEIPLTFSKDLTLLNPGSYSYRIILKPKSGRQIASISQEVDVRLAPGDAGMVLEEEE